MSVALAGRPVRYQRALAVLALVVAVAPRAAADPPPLPPAMQVEVNWAIDQGARYLRAKRHERGG